MRKEIRLTLTNTPRCRRLIRLMPLYGGLAGKLLAKYGRIFRNGKREKLLYLAALLPESQKDMGGRAGLDIYAEYRNTNRIQLRIFRQLFRDLPEAAQSKPVSQDRIIGGKETDFRRQFQPCLTETGRTEGTQTPDHLIRYRRGRVWKEFSGKLRIERIEIEKLQNRGKAAAPYYTKFSLRYQSYCIRYPNSGGNPVSGAIRRRDTDCSENTERRTRKRERGENRFESGRKTDIFANPVFLARMPPAIDRSRKAGLLQTPDQRILNRPLQAPGQRILNRLLQESGQRILNRLLQAPGQRILNRLLQTSDRLVLNRLLQTPGQHVLNRLFQREEGGYGGGTGRSAEKEYYFKGRGWMETVRRAGFRRNRTNQDGRPAHIFHRTIPQYETGVIPGVPQTNRSAGAYPGRKPYPAAMAGCVTKLYETAGNHPAGKRSRTAGTEHPAEMERTDRLYTHISMRTSLFTEMKKSMDVHAERFRRFGAGRGFTRLRYSHAAQYTAGRDESYRIQSPVSCRLSGRTPLFEAADMAGKRISGIRLCREGEKRYRQLIRLPARETRFAEFVTAPYTACGQNPDTRRSAGIRKPAGPFRREQSLPAYQDMYADPCRKDRREEPVSSGTQTELQRRKLEQIEYKNRELRELLRHLKPEQADLPVKTLNMKQARKDLLRAIVNPKQLLAEYLKRDENTGRKESPYRERLQSLLAPETAAVFETLREYRKNPDKLIREGIVLPAPERLFLQDTLNAEKVRNAGAVRNRAVRQKLIYKKAQDVISGEPMPGPYGQKRDRISVRSVQSREYEAAANAGPAVNAIAAAGSGWTAGSPAAGGNPPDRLSLSVQKQLTDQISRQMKQQMDILTEQVYAKLEKKMENERKRRGL